MKHFTKRYNIPVERKKKVDNNLKGVKEQWRVSKTAQTTVNRVPRGFVSGMDYGSIGGHNQRGDGDKSPVLFLNDWHQHNPSGRPLFLAGRWMEVWGRARYRGDEDDSLVLLSRNQRRLNPSSQPFDWLADGLTQERLRKGGDGIGGTQLPPSWPIDATAIQLASHLIGWLMNRSDCEWSLGRLWHVGM